MAKKMDQVKFTAKNLYFLGKDFESRDKKRFQEIIDKLSNENGLKELFEQHPNLKYQMIGQLVMDQGVDKKKKKEEVKPNAKLPVAQTLVQQLLWKHSIKNIDIKAFNEIMSLLDLKGETLDVLKEQKEFVREFEKAVEFEGDRFPDLSNTDIDGEGSDYDFNAFSLIAKMVIEPGETSNTDEPDVTNI